MMLHDTGIRHLHAARSGQPGWPVLRRPARPRLRITLASLFATLARRLAPEVLDPTVLRTRAAPN